MTDRPFTVESLLPSNVLFVEGEAPKVIVDHGQAHRAFHQAIDDRPDRWCGATLVGRGQCL